MRRTVLTLALAGLFGLALSAGEARACHKRSRCAEPCAPVVKCAPEPKCCETAPACEPAPCKKRKRLGCGLFSGGLFKRHRKAKACAEPCGEPCAPAPCGTPVYYSVVVPSGQGTYPAPQGMPAIPSKQVH
jgi:hypothetical protein